MWRFRSSSGSGMYETLKYDDGSLSCDCPGWTRRAIRSCKHTRAVENGDANAMAQSSTPLLGVVPVTPDQVAAQVTATPQLIKGKFNRKFS